MTTVVQIER